MNTEVRHSRELKLTDLKVREQEGLEESRVVEGYALKFGVRSKLLSDWYDQYYEILEPGCVSREMLDQSDILFTLYHDMDKVLGRSQDGEGTLQLVIDEIGLLVRCSMPKTVWGDEALELVKRGDLSGMSFVYSTREDDSAAVSYELINEDGNDIYLRHVHRIDRMYDVSVVRFPAYKQTEVSARERESIEALKPREENEHSKDEEKARAKREKVERLRRMARAAFR